VSYFSSKRRRHTNEQKINFIYCKAKIFILMKITHLSFKRSFFFLLLQIKPSPSVPTLEGIDSSGRDLIEAEVLNFLIVLSRILIALFLNENVGTNLSLNSSSAFLLFFSLEDCSCLILYLLLQNLNPILVFLFII